ncbi:HAMP domain-containing sensor histidine kinase [Sphingomonas sp.]|jgi:signal transduction histidine kinase|uniref:sensor histidine kinase n=1 Tax=Sphingomonas sp. TaxID=28214 RepID=UPI002D807324|nr:HAMP domain-containing sensor histidine kinase [Sphingomonas sp.]HEU0045246.1 HAMP domain-containing sensor histidine kinase [Sphingomonas sp.]
MAGFALAATLLLYVVTALVVRTASDAELTRAVNIELTALADIHATGGRDELIARVADRLMLQPQSSDLVHYMVADASGKRVAGDIARWPLLSAENSEAGFIVLPGGRSTWARATQLAPDLRIVAAREHRGRTELLRNLALAFAGAALLIVAAAAGAAWLAARRLRARVEAINAVFRAIEEGALRRAVPGTTAPDELGTLASHADRLLARLADLIDAQREVTDQVAHEIRTPLVHLDAHLLRLIERSVDPAMSEALGEARREGRGIAQLLDSLLDIAASRARRNDRVGFERVDLSEIAAGVAELYADSAEEAGLRLETRIAPGVELPGDAMQLTRLLSNLLDNAFKYVPAGGRIELVVAPGPRVEVRDDGPGVPDSARERIFERFQRVQGGNQQGHGLGLALARSIAARHDLTIRCEDGAPGCVMVIEMEGTR